MGHVSLVTLGVRDVERAAAYYEAVGWERSSASVEGVVAFLRGGTVALGLFGADALRAEAGEPLAGRSGDGEPVPGSPAPTMSLATNVGSPAEVAALLARHAAAGGTVTAPAAATDWGGTSGYVRDLDGHLWEVAHNPGFPLDDEGRVTLP